MQIEPRRKEGRRKVGWEAGEQGLKRFGGTEFVTQRAMGRDLGDLDCVIRASPR